ncbi:nitroreductase [Lewinella sp. 4G2]|uniref:nitroreductase family protein n=1 Tax=Lewinella sp. 4G2 TaxID=1803372 RepID=UPI0007B47169|nr:nitroreductase [Lewinella sp. 4G2]OAV44756.1 hypothetical protein A3850_009755 [Lewinella sp. 4G2]
MLAHVENRRSIFPQFFTDQPVAEATLRTLLAAANLAPSHRKTEPWRFRVYQGTGKDQLLDELRTVYNQGAAAGAWGEKLEKKFGKKLTQSPVVLAIFLHRDEAESVPEWEEVAAVGCAVENLWTSLDAFGLGGYWSSPGFMCGGYGEFPGAGERERCLGLFYLGHHAAPDLPRPRGNWEDKVTFVGAPA